MLNIFTLTGRVENGHQDFVGQKYAGKDLFCDYAKEVGINVRSVAQADGIKDILNEVYGIEEAKQKESEVMGCIKSFTYRQMCERIGSTYVALDKLVWVKMAHNKIKKMFEDHKKKLLAPLPKGTSWEDFAVEMKQNDLPLPDLNVIVSDVRFKHELDYWKSLGAISIVIKRTNVNGIPFNPEKDHVSNSWPFGDVKFDHEVDNNGTKQQLKQRAKDCLVTDCVCVKIG